MQEAVNEWRELNTAADFTSLCQEVHQYSGSLPVLLVHKQLVLDAICARMQVQVRGIPHARRLNRRHDCRAFVVCADTPCVLRSAFDPVDMAAHRVPIDAYSNLPMFTAQYESAEARDS